MQVGRTVRTMKQAAQELVENPAPIAQLQVGQIFKIRLVMDMTE